MNAPSPTLHQDVPLTRSERRMIILGTLLPLFLGSVDQTVLANALPTIGRDIGHVSELPWLVTAYLLAATAMIPLHGKISDIRGRRFTVIAALLLYIAGSAISVMAPNFYLLVLGRAVQGLGGGGLVSLAMVILGDVASPKERGPYYVYFSFTFTTSGALGPLLGGVVAEYLHWRALFGINIVLGLLALMIVAPLLKKLPRRERPHRLDVLGAVLIVVASVSFMLALNVGGVRAPWMSAPVLALLAVAALTGFAFVIRLNTAPEPLIPLAIFGPRDARCAIAANAFGWSAIMVLNIYLPTYLQTVLGLTATQAGLSLIALMVSTNIGAGISGQILGRVQRYKTVPLIAFTISIVATAVLAAYADRVTPLTFQLLLVCIGIGFGPVAPLSTVVLQNVVAPHQFGSAVATMNFTRSLLGTILVAAAGAMVLAGFTPAELGPAIPAAAARPFGLVFIGTALCLACAFVAVFLMSEAPLRTEEPRD